MAPFVAVPHRWRTISLILSFPTSVQKSPQTSEEEFLAECPELTRILFSTLIEKAQESDFVIKWGTKGFSLRIMKQDRPISILYGYPPGGSSHVHKFEAYLEYVDPESRDSIRDEFCDHLPFINKGKYTLSIELDAQHLDQVLAGIPKVLEIAKQAVLDN